MHDYPTAGPGDKPILLIDVDGPLNPYMAKATRRPVGYETLRLPVPGRSQPMRIWFNRAHGPMLLSLADVFELHWGTWWEDEANRVIAPLLGLPVLPFVNWAAYGALSTRMTVLPPFGETLSAGIGGHRRPVETVHWKTRPIGLYTGGRPFAWIDDEITDADRNHLAKVSSVGPHLLRHIDPRIGLSDWDISRLRKWAEAL